eukprot:5861636-Pleurochrysis_carterae.AAC.1
MAPPSPPPNGERVVVRIAHINPREGEYSTQLITSRRSYVPILKNFGQGSRVIFDSERLKKTGGVYCYTPTLRVRRSLGALKRSTRIEPTDIFSWRRKSRRQPHHEETWARLTARASELQVRSKSWRAWCMPRKPILALLAPSRVIGSRQLKES